MNFIHKLKKFTKLIKNQIWRRGLLNNIAANIELENLIKDLKFETILDVGSNKGQFILLVESLFKNKIVYSFEPIKEILQKQKIFFEYKNNIYFFNIGLGEKSEKKVFYITNRKDSSSFLKFHKNDIKNSDYKIDEERIVEIKALDKVISSTQLVRPILLKIDVQGYELNVLKGCSDLLKKTSYIIVEVSENEIYQDQPVANQIIEYLNKRNFIIIKENLATNISKSNLFQKDILFKNQLID